MVVYHQQNYTAPCNNYCGLASNSYKVIVQVQRERMSPPMFSLVYNKITTNTSKGTINSDNLTASRQDNLSE